MGVDPSLEIVRCGLRGPSDSSDILIKLRCESCIFGGGGGIFRKRLELVLCGGLRILPAMPPFILQFKLDRELDSDNLDVVRLGDP